MNSDFYKQNFELIHNNRKILNNTKFLKKNFVSKHVKKNSIPFASSNSISWSVPPGDEHREPNHGEETVQNGPVVNKFKQKKKSLQYILKNLKHLHFQQKNQVQSSVLTYPIKDFLKKHPSTNFVPFFPLDCAMPFAESNLFKQSSSSSKRTTGPESKIPRTTNVSYYSPYFVVKEGDNQNSETINKWFDSITKQTKFKSSKEDLTKIFTVRENFSNVPQFLNSNSIQESRVSNEEDSSSAMLSEPNGLEDSGKQKLINPVLSLGGDVEKGTFSEKVPLMKYSKLHELKLVTISIASPEKIKEWAEKTLPNGKIFGEVTNANTLHYKTFKPHKGGLFCERIFGPLKDFECACGIYSKPNELESKKILQHEQIQRTFCPNCDVEYTWSVIRRYQLGYIQLVSPVSHIWYLKANPSYLSLLLDFKRSFLESIIYCTKSITLENLFKKSEKNLFDTSPKNLYSVWQKLIEEEKFINTTEKLRNNFRKTQKNKTGLLKTQIFQKIFKIQKRFKIAKLKNSKSSQLEQLAGMPYTSFHFSTNCSPVCDKPEQPTRSGRMYGKDKAMMKAMLQTKFHYSIYTMNNVFIYVVRSLDSHPSVSALPKRSETQSETVQRHALNTALPYDQSIKSFLSNTPAGGKASPPVPFGQDRIQKRNFWKFSSLHYGVSLRTQKNQRNKLFIKNFHLVQRLEKMKEEYGVHQKLSPLNSTMVSKKLTKNFLLKNSFNLFYFKKIYSQILQTKEKIRSEILFSNLINLNKSKPNSKKENSSRTSFELSELLLDSSLSAIQTSSLFEPKEELKNKLLQNLHTNNAKNKNFKKSLVQNSFFIFFIGFFFSRSSKQLQGNYRFTEEEKGATGLGNYPKQGKALASPESHFFQKFLKQIFCLSFLNQNFYFLELTTCTNLNRRYQVQNCFYAFFLNFKLTNIFSLNNIPGIPSNTNKTLKFFYYTSGLKLTKKIQKISKILNSMNLNFSINSKKNFSLYNNFKRKKSFKNLKLISFFFEIFHSSFLNTSSVLVNETSDLRFAKQLEELDFSSKNKNSFPGNVPNSFFKDLESRKKALFLKKQKEIQFQKLSNSFKQKRSFKKFSSGIQKNVPNSFFSKKFIYVMDQFIGLFPLRGRSVAGADRTPEKNFLSSSGKKLKNPLYTISYFYAWPSELDWKSFMYYNSENLSLNDKPIALYRNGTFQKFSGETAAAKFQTSDSALMASNTGNPFLTRKGAGFLSDIPFEEEQGQGGLRAVRALWAKARAKAEQRKQNNFRLAEVDRKSVSLKKTSAFMHETKNQSIETLTGASLIQKLLTELDSVEFQKMIKQHQILIPIVNRSIRKLSKNLGQFGIGKADKSGSLDTLGNRPKASQTKSDLLKLQKLLQKRDHIIRRFKFLSKISWASLQFVETRNSASSVSASTPWKRSSTNGMGYSSQQTTNATSMILTILPVLPPDLRPILKLQNQIAASDLNRLYQRIIYRNERLKKFLKDPSTSQSFEMKYAQRLLQEAVDNLIENGKGSVKPETNARGQALKSLSEILKGKQGRFRQYLLGKRVDYSGRSVIVVGPSLKLSECGLPLRIAIELFLPFLIKKILHYKLAKTVIGAKNFIYKNNDFTWNLLNEIMKNHPILLNRAPTLHRLGIQAFLPKLIQGQAILLHPLVCPAFNADFDGDQMAVHVPITVEARTEAWSFLFSRNHLLSAATGEPIILPSQDMVLGCYYLTSENSPFKSSSTSWSSARMPTSFSGELPPTRKIPTSHAVDKSKWAIQKKSKSNQISYGEYDSFSQRKIELVFQQPRFQRKCFYNWDAVLNAYQKNQILLQSVIWVRWNGKMEFSNESFSPLEIRVNSFGHYEKIKSKSVLSLKPFVQKPYLNHFVCNQYIRTTPGRVLINNVIQNCMRF